jgi:retinol-binding protein 3
MTRTRRFESPSFAAALLFLAPALASAAAPPIDAAERKRVVEGAIRHLDTGYVFPETAAKMAASLRANLAKGDYDRLTEGKAFAERLTADLQAVSHDKHLRLLWSADEIPVRPDPTEEKVTPEEEAKQRDYWKLVNHGFEKADRLPGNIGYVEIRGFVPASEGGEKAAAAMSLLADTDALIVDLRRNGGGEPDMVALVCSYLFDEPTHLNSLWWREGDRTQQFWTTPFVSGRKFGGTKPVYVLTSSRTFSGAEEFSYNLKSRKRATLVGETTGGGAHPGWGRRIDEHFELWVPAGRAINPITKTNWEGTGVSPDVAVPADEALEVAHVDALEKALAKAPEDRKEPLWAALKDAKEKLDAVRAGKMKKAA